MTGRPRPLVGVSLKMYLGIERTRRWLTDVRAALAASPPDIDIFVAPTFLSVPDAASILAGTPVRTAAQDVFWEDAGPYAGEVSAAILAEAGCAYVEVGHAERRRLFGEDDGVVAAKAAAAVRAGLIPVVCVGEERRQPSAQAAASCAQQLARVLGAVPDAAELVVAYEPGWAIGARLAADPAHVGAVVGAMRSAVAGRTGTIRFLYGGSAGPGTFTSLVGSVDGVFLGRFAHDVPSFVRILHEMADAVVDRIR